MSYEKKTELELIVIGLDWCSEFKAYGNLPVEKDPSNQKALAYDKAWVRLIKRIKDYAEDNDNLIKIYNGLSRLNRFNKQLTNIICSLLAKEGYNRGLLMFTTDEEIQKMLETGDFNFNDQQSMGINK